MNTRNTLITTAVLLALSQSALLAATPVPAHPVAAATAQAPAAKAPVVARSPSEWIEYDDATYTPVLDDVSQALANARHALDQKDHAKAADAMRAAARALHAQGERAARLDRQRAAADLKLASDTRQRMMALADKLDATARQIQAGQVPTKAVLDQTLGKAARADLERRWLVTDVSTWFPVVEEPQSHFTAAVQAYAKKDYQAAAAEVRKAGAYIRREAAGATGDAKAALVATGAELDKTAQALQKGGAVAQKDVEQVFARADHALALAHRAKAADAWAHKAYDSVGYELKAAAHGLESAASWTGGETRAAAQAASVDARAVGDKLASGGVWARDEVAKGFESLGSGLNRLGQSIGVKSQAKSFDVGA